MPVAADVALPEVSPVVFAGAGALSVSLPAVAGVVSLAVFAGGGGGVAADMAPLADGHCWSDCPDGYWERTSSQTVETCSCHGGLVVC